MEEIIKTERRNHDAHDIILSILYYFPEEAKWDELSFHEALHKVIFRYRILDRLEFKNTNGIYYSDEIGKVFDLLELSGLLKRKEDSIKLWLEIIKSHFDGELRQSFIDADLEDLRSLSEEIQKLLGIKYIED